MVVITESCFQLQLGFVSLPLSGRARPAFFVNCCREVVLFRAKVGRCREQITRWAEGASRLS